MQVEINAKEMEYLMELLKAAHDQLLHELHHTDTQQYKDLLLEKAELVESLQRKLVSRV